MLRIGTNERRFNLRYRYTTGAAYGNDDRMGQGLVLNLSLGGLFIATNSKLSVGKEILVTIPFTQSNRHVSLRGIVVRINEEGFAISFLGRPHAQPAYSNWQP